MTRVINSTRFMLQYTCSKTTKEIDAMKKMIITVKFVGTVPYEMTNILNSVACTA